MAVKSLYNSMKSSVMGDDVAMEFNVGLRQGCVLSPLLFSLFMNRLVLLIRQKVKGVKINDDEVRMLMFADDIVLMMEESGELQKALDICTIFAWR